MTESEFLNRFSLLCIYFIGMKNLFTEDYFYEEIIVHL